MSKPATSAMPDVERAALSIDEVAAMLGCSPNHVRRMAAEGADGFPRTVRLGARVLLDRGAVLAWLRRDSTTVERARSTVQVRG